MQEEIYTYEVTIPEQEYSKIPPKKTKEEEKQKARAEKYNLKKG